MRAEHSGVRGHRRRGPIWIAGSIFAAAGLAFALTTPGAARAGSDGMGPENVISASCAGDNAEVVQAVGPPHYVYEAWIGCGGEGFARSTDGGLHFSQPIMLPDSSQSDDPALAVATDGTVYVSYLRYANGYAYPVVATSFDHGSTFPQVASLTPEVQGNWGDRDFIAAGRDGSVHVTWDYGPSAADVKFVCSPVGSCAYSNVDANAVVQNSTDHGKTWGPITAMQPDFPAGGGYDGSVVVEPDGRIDALVWNHHLNPATFAVPPGYESFTSSTDGGKTWSPMTPVGASAGTIALPTWWIDGNLGIDRAGNLYATWATQNATRGTAWISYSTDHGQTWSTPQQVLSGSADATEDIQVVGATAGVADVAWQDDTAASGYSTHVRQFSIAHGWTGPAVQVSSEFGDRAVWPGDTFGLSVLPGNPRTRVIVSWGGGQTQSQIRERVVDLP